MTPPVALRVFLRVCAYGCLCSSLFPRAVGLGVFVLAFQASLMCFVFGVLREKILQTCAVYSSWKWRAGPTDM